jgi:hypothetical protein
MAKTEKKIEAMEAEVEQVVEATANPQADAPKKNAVAAEPSKLSNEAEDLGPAVVKPTDSNPDATKKISKISGDPQQKSQGTADATPKLKEEDESEKEDKKSEVKEGEMPKAALDALKKSQDKKEMSHDNEKKKDMKEESEEDIIDISADVEALTKDEDLSEEFKVKSSDNL